MGARNRVISGITCHYKPTLTANGVIPEFTMRAGRIVSEVNVLDEAIERIERRRVRPLKCCVAQIDKLAQVAGAAMRARDSHRLLSAD